MTETVRPNPRDDLFQWVMSVPNPYTGESSWDRMQREAAGEELPQLDPSR